MKLLIGTGVYVDFPTINGNIYTRQAVEKAISDQYLRDRLANGAITGGILDPKTCKPIDDVMTHKVLDIKLYKEEIIVEIDVFDDTKSFIKSLEHPQAAIVMVRPQQLRNGQTITEIDEIRTVHLRENPIYKRNDA